MADDKKILLLESDPRLSREWAEGFRDFGYRVAETADVADGLAKALGSPPDLIVVRVELNGANGYKAAKSFRQEDRLRGVPMVILSSSSTEADFDADRKTQTPAQAYRKVPLAFDDLLDDVEELIGLPSLPPERFAEPTIDAASFEALGQRNDELVAKSERLQGERDRLAAQVNEIRSERDRLSARVSEMEGELAAARAVGGGGTEKLKEALEATTIARDEARRELEAKKKVIAQLKQNLQALESRTASGGGSGGKESDDEMGRRRAAMEKLKERIEAQERVAATANREREELAAQLAAVEKKHQKELDALKGYYEPKLAALKEEARRGSKGGSEVEEMRRAIARLEDEKAKMEERVVKAFRRLRASESRLEKVSKALQIAMGMAKVQQKKEPSRGEAEDE